jgi:gas vesicle protein
MNRDQFVNSYGQPMDWLMVTARRNPEAFLVMAAGAALLLRGRGSSPNQAPDYRRMRNWEGSGGQSEASDPGRADNMRESARGFASTVSDTTDRAAGAASDYASAASDAVRSYASTAAEYASETGQAVRSQASRMADQATSFASQAQSAVQSGAATVMREQPLAVALLGVAAGAAVAALFPATKLEERTLGPARDALTEAARDMGENVVQSAKEAGEHLKQSAVERGLTPDGMKEMAREAAGAFTSRMSGKAEQQSGNPSSSGSTPPSSMPGNGQPI